VQRGGREQEEEQEEVVVCSLEAQSEKAGDEVEMEAKNQPRSWRGG